MAQYDVYSMKLVGPGNVWERSEQPVGVIGGVDLHDSQELREVAARKMKLGPAEKAHLIKRYKPVTRRDPFAFVHACKVNNRLTYIWRRCDPE